VVGCCFILALATSGAGDGMDVLEDGDGEEVVLTLFGRVKAPVVLPCCELLLVEELSLLQLVVVAALLLLFDLGMGARFPIPIKGGRAVATPRFLLPLKLLEVPKTGRMLWDIPPDRAIVALMLVVRLGGEEEEEEEDVLAVSVVEEVVEGLL